jgi:hypothetical protein
MTGRFATVDFVIGAGTVGSGASSAVKSATA